MNPHPELTFRIETLAAEQNRRETELRRVIHERTAPGHSRSLRALFGGLRRRTARTAASSGGDSPAAVPCSGSHAHA